MADKGTLWPVLRTALAFALPVALIVIPMLAFLAQSFWYVEGGDIVRRPTLVNYVRIAVDGISIPIFLKTCRLAVEVMALTVLVGYPIAYLLWTLEDRLKSAMLLIFVIPLFMSYIIKIYAIRGLLGRTGLVNQFLVFAGILEEPSTALLFNLTAVKITLALILIPFAILPIFISLERIPRNLLEASTDLGAGGWLTFRWIVLPLSAPGAVAGATFCFVLALGDFVTPQMVGGPNGFTFGRIIHSQFGMAFNWPFGAALSVVLLIVVIGALGVGYRFGRQPGGPP